jgi:hypothetical protein
MISRGEAANRLIANPDFAEVLNDLSNFHVYSLIHLPPGDATREKRDHHHLMIAALRDISYEVQARSRELQEFVDEREAAANPQRDEEYE